jgi:hypothetical protein
VRAAWEGAAAAVKRYAAKRGKAKQAAQGQRGGLADEVTPRQVICCRCSTARCPRAVVVMVMGRAGHGWRWRGRCDVHDASPCARCSHIHMAARPLALTRYSPQSSVQTTSITHYQYQYQPAPAPHPVATALFITALPSPTPASRPLLALRSAPYVLSASLSVTSPAPLPCDSTRHCPERRVTLGRPVYYQSSTTSLHRGLLNSLHAASPLSQWTRKQR